MKVIFCGDAAETYVPALGDIVPHGVAIDVDDELAVSLLEQPANWTTPTTTSTAPAAGEED